MRSVLVGERPLQIWWPVDETSAPIIGPDEHLLPGVLDGLRPKTLLEVGSDYGLAGLLALQEDWATTVHWVMRDVRGAKVANETLRRGSDLDAEVVLGEGPLDAPRDAYDSVVVHQQRSRYLTEALIHQAATKVGDGGCLILSGGTKEGVNVAARVLEAACGSVEEVAARGARVVYGRSPTFEGALAEGMPISEYATTIDDVTVRWLTKPGVFSADGPDPASELLLSCLRLPHKGRILDLGCGAGLLGLWAAKRMPGVKVTMVDSDVSSVGCAEAGIVLNGLDNAEATLSDGVAELQGRKFDIVLTNPPIHRSGRREAGLAERFASEAAGAIGRKGRLWLVVAPTVPLGRTLDELYTEVAIAADDGSSRVFDAIRRPRRHIADEYPVYTERARRSK
jgi:16S rRNA (guanine1207-N2)-methyltransferase